MNCKSSNVTKHKRAIQNRLLRWFDSKHRELPWLVKKSPYRIWVSEIMLQQTQIATVIDYYRRFVKRFPNIRRLAAADVDEVLRLWEGLGYYRRARQLHAASKVIIDKHKGRFPTRLDHVLALPGVGRYTAAAILSIALDQKLPILEGNTVRLFSRLMCWQDDITKSDSQKQLWQFSESLLPNQRVGDFNQALMDFGRDVCKAKEPDCENCQLAEYCQSYILRKQDQIPYRAQKIQYEELNEAIVLIQRGHKVLLRKCRENERWAGLWDFPRFKMRPDAPPSKLELDIQGLTGLNTTIEPFNYTIKHAVTKFRIKLECFQVTSITGRLRRDNSYSWRPISDLVDLPLSTTGRKFADRYL